MQQVVSVDIDGQINIHPATHFAGWFIIFRHQNILFIDPDHSAGFEYTAQSGHRQQLVTPGTDPMVDSHPTDPQGLTRALEQLDLHSSEALYVGDAREDCKMAKAAGVPFVGLTREFATVSGVEDCTQLASLDELAAIIQ